MRNQIDKIKGFSQFINENVITNIVGYHTSENNFDIFDSSKDIGNFGTVLDGSYFLSSITGLSNFGNYGVIYKVNIKPKCLFLFDLETDEHWYLTTEFQELFSESLAGISNYLDGFFDAQNIENVEDIDCIYLTNIDYLDDKTVKEYIVLDDNIITILNKQNIN